MDENVSRRTIFDKLFSFMNYLNKDNKSTEYILKSRFSNYLNGLDRKSETYSFVKTAAELCDDAMKLYRRKQNIQDNIQNIEKRMEEIECFHNLGKEETDKLQALLDKFVNISREKNDLYYSLSGFEQGLGYLEAIEEDANFALEQIKEAEKKQRILRHDVGYIEGEKAELEYQKERIEKSLEYFRYFGLGLISIFIAGIFTFSYAFVVLSADILMPASVLAASVFLLSVTVFILRRRADYEIRMNLKKQKRAIELLNKKNTVLAYYTNFLRFEYKKYRVNSSNTLEENLSDLQHYRHLNKRYDTIRKIMYKSEQEIETFLRHKEIKSTSASIETFSKTINLENKRKYYSELEEERNHLENEIISIDKQNDELWDLILVLHENDKTEEKLVDRIIQDYYDEIGVTIDSSAVFV